MHITNKISQNFHKFASKEFPKPIQNFINNSYVNILGLDMSEFQSPSSYKTLNALFTRALVKERTFDESDANFICVADSYVSAQGAIEDGIALQIKGMQYSIERLFTSNVVKENIERLKNGTFMNFYLSPKDYHRYHSPYSAKVTKLIYVPGKLYPVNFTYLNKQDELFVENERVILECVTSDNKLFYMAYIGALNVGKMVFDFEPRVATNDGASQIEVFEYDDLYIKKGECLGHFKMGSTVLLFWEKDMVELENLEDTKVRFTDIIAILK
ncbi:MAG: phosphatidylserine decarboxylase [Arcobacteraceae bacterium]|jgi:phosphatidylserine decarboxylase|nr:phosphatidylserine decarboxylase [Arcobacteraceae bacterium]